MKIISLSLKSPFSNLRLGWLLALGLLLAAPASRAEPEITPKDEAFLLAASQGAMLEVRLGELAAHNARRAEVKEFGERMVMAHSASHRELQTLARQKGVTLPEGLDAKHQRQLDKMAALPITEFDAVYISTMIKGHQAVSRQYLAESASTKDTDIRGFVDQTIPVVSEHLARSKALKAQH